MHTQYTNYPLWIGPHIIFQYLTHCGYYQILLLHGELVVVFAPAVAGIVAYRAGKCCLQLGINGPGRKYLRHVDSKE